MKRQMKRLSWIFCFPILVYLLSACDDQSGLSPLKKSDYTGSFFTQAGQCPGSAEMGISLNKDKIEIAFYCFIKACYTAKGKLSQGGFFEINRNEREFITGRLSPDKATGEWWLVINGKECSGRFEAERTKTY